jgi:hypothetical protein
MLVKACDLETTHDRRTWIDENQRSIPSSSRQPKQGMQACAVHEDEFGQFELQLVVRWKRTDCFRKYGGRGEVEVSREREAPSVRKRRYLEFRRHGTSFPAAARLSAPA